METLLITGGMYLLFAFGFWIGCWFERTEETYNKNTKKKEEKRKIMGLTKI